MLVKKADAKYVRNSDALAIREYFTPNEDSSIGLSVAEVDGAYGINLNKVCRLVFYVIDGGMTVELEGAVNKLSVGDAIMIHPNIKYSVRGKATFVISSSPAWYFEQYEVLPEMGSETK